MGWNVKSFDWFGHRETERIGHSWHIACTECLRSNFAFVIHSNPMSNTLLEEDFNLYSWSMGVV